MSRTLHVLLVTLLAAVFLLPFATGWHAVADASLPDAISVSTPLSWSTLAASVLVGISTAALAVIIGFWLATVFSLTDFPAAALWSMVALFPFMCPGAVWALGQVYCYGAGGLAKRVLGDAWRPALSWVDRGQYVSTVWVLAQIHAPLAMLIISRGMSRLHHCGGEAALFYLSVPRFFAWLLRALRGELVAGFLLTLALTLGNFIVPHVLQCRLYAIGIYMRMNNYLDHAGALNAALPLLVISCVAAAMIGAGEKTEASSALQTTRPLHIPLRRRKYLVGAALGGYLFIVSLLPLGALLYECRSMSHFVEAAQDARLEMANTVCIAVAAGMVASLTALLVGTFVRGGRFVSAATTAPLGIPALIVGLVYLRHYDRLLSFVALSETAALVVLGLAFRGLPFTIRPVMLGIRRIPASSQFAARSSSIGILARWRYVMLPLLFDHVATGAIMVFVIAAGDVEISQLLCAPGQGTLALRLFTFLHFGPTHVAANLAVLQMLICMTPLVAYFVVCRRCLQFV